MAALDPFDDRHKQVLARPEVVQQHSVAGADGGSDLAQRPIADAARGELLDQRIEQLLAPVQVRTAGHWHG